MILSVLDVYKRQEYYTQEELNEYMAPAEGSFDRGAWLNEQLNNGVDDETKMCIRDSLYPYRTQKLSFSALKILGG